MDSTRRTLDIRAQHNFMLSFLLLIINWCGIVDSEKASELEHKRWPFSNVEYIHRLIVWVFM